MPNIFLLVPSEVHGQSRYRRSEAGWSEIAGSVLSPEKGNLRLSWVYLLLGQKPQRLLGDKETNRPETAKPFSADVVALVKGKSA